MVLFHGYRFPPCLIPKPDHLFWDYVTQILILLANFLNELRARK